MSGQAKDTAVRSISLLANLTEFGRFGGFHGLKIKTL
jgi:hypothetical protein